MLLEGYMHAQPNFAWLNNRRLIICDSPTVYTAASPKSAELAEIAMASLICDRTGFKIRHGETRLLRACVSVAIACLLVL